MYAEAVRLLREEKYQEALEKWQEIKSIDAKYPDRQKVQRTARKSLAAMAKPVTRKAKITIPRSLWIGLGGIGAVVILVFGIILFGNSENNALLAPMKVPKATNIPQKTSTLRSATVVPTSLPELPEYDNFDNASFEGSYNPGLWQIAYDGGKIYQESGNLKFAVEQTGADWLYAGLIAKDYANYKITHPISFEAKMSLNTADSGGVFMQLESVNKNSKYAIYACGIERGEDLHVKCTTSESEGVFEDIFYSEYVLASWHTFRFTVDPDKNEINFFMDDKLIGSYTSNYPDNFSNTLYSLYLQSYVYKTGESTALVDYVRIDAPATSGYADPTMYDDFEQFCL